MALELCFFFFFFLATSPYGGPLPLLFFFFAVGWAASSFSQSPAIETGWTSFFLSLRRSGVMTPPVFSCFSVRAFPFFSLPEAVSSVSTIFFPLFLFLLVLSFLHFFSPPFPDEHMESLLLVLTFPFRGSQTSFPLFFSYFWGAVRRSSLSPPRAVRGRFPPPFCLFFRGPFKRGPLFFFPSPGPYQKLFFFFFFFFLQGEETLEASSLFSLI